MNEIEITPLRLDEAEAVVELAGRVWRAHYPGIITPAQIVYQWSQYSTTTDAFGFCFAYQGHVLYVITFPSGNATCSSRTTNPFSICPR